MDNLQHVLTTLLRMSIEIGNILLDMLVASEEWAHDRLSQLGLSANVQTVTMTTVTLVLILFALRLFGGLIRFIVVVALLLVAIHILLPILPHS